MVGKNRQHNKHACMSVLISMILAPFYQVRYFVSLDRETKSSCTCIGTFESSGKKNYGEETYMPVMQTKKQRFLKMNSMVFLNTLIYIYIPLPVYYLSEVFTTIARYSRFGVFLS